MTDEERIRRINAKHLEEIRTGKLGWFYISFASKTGWLGGCFVQGWGFGTACQAAKLLGCNPGGEAFGGRVDEDIDRVPDDYRNRLLTRADLEEIAPGSVTTVKEYREREGYKGDFPSACSSCQEDSLARQEAQLMNYKAAWNRQARAKNRAAGLCRCGRKRQLGYIACRDCRAVEVARRQAAIEKGACHVCRKRKPMKGRTRCRLCTERTNARRREAMALYEQKKNDAWRPLYPTAHKVAQELRQVEAGSVDVELAVLLVAASLERLGRPDEASVLRLQAGELLMRAGLHEAEHPGPIALGQELASVLNPGLGTFLGTSQKEEVSDDS